MFSKIKTKISGTDAAKIWAKNSAEVDAERVKNKGSRKGLIAFIRLFHAVAVCFTTYLVVVTATTFIVPMLVSYIGGSANITQDTNIFVTLSTWLFPSMLVVMLVFAFCLFAIKKINAAWRIVFNRVIAKIKTNAAKKQASKNSNTSKSGKSKSKR